MMRKHTFIYLLLILLVSSTNVFSQDQIILNPKPLFWTPIEFDDQSDLFGKAWRFYRDGYSDWSADSLKKLIEQAGFHMDKRHYYIVVANFNPSETPIGMFHGNASFLENRLYGLQSDSLFYIFITRDTTAKSYLSTVLTQKGSYFEENLINFIMLFPFISQVKSRVVSEFRTWIDVRKFEIPKKFQKNCDIAVIVKKDFYDDIPLARAKFDNTSLEKWSFGVATAITSVSDVDFAVEDGIIVIKPKPKGDLATFGVINYHFKAVDTKAKSMATSFHLLGGMRISNTIEPILGVGVGLPLGFIDLHLFAGYSVEFAQGLDDGYDIGETVTSDVDPFKLKVRGKPRIGIELKFP